MHDLQLAVRGLWSTPIVSLVAVLSLALGIGANTAIFSLVNSLLLRQLPVADPQQLVTVTSSTALSHGLTSGLGWSYAMWERFAPLSGEFAGAFAWTAAEFNFADGGEIQPANGVFATGEFFSTLGVPVLRGRTFTRADDVRGGGADGPVAVISHGLWQRRFQGREDALGSRLAIDGVPFTIVGITGPGFHGIEIGQQFDVALPLATEPLVHGKRSIVDSDRSLFLAVMLRLKANQTREAATATMRTLQRAILGVGDVDLAELPPFLTEPYTLVPAATGSADRSGLRRGYTRPLLTLFAIVALVLLVACANIANLLLARATARRHELSIRVALGAPRWRLARELLVESFVLAGAGTIVGSAVALWGSRLLVRELSSSINPVALDLAIDWRMAAFTASVTVVTAVVFGTAPAFHATRATPLEALKEHGRTTPPITWAARGAGVSSLVLSLQVALSLVLVVGAGLFVKTFGRLAHVPLGFDADRILVVSVETARARVDTTGSSAPVNRVAFYQRLVNEVWKVPGVANAAGSAITPLSSASQALLFNQPGMVMEHLVTPAWFDTYGTHLQSGRDFDSLDYEAAPPVVIVDQTFVNRFFPDKPAIGQTVNARSCGQRGCLVVGVVGDAIFGSPRHGMRPTIYRPMTQTATVGPPGKSDFNISVRADGATPPSALAPSVRATLNAVDNNLAFSFRTLDDDVEAVLGQERLVAMLSGFFGVLALLLAALGLYGVTAYLVCRRETEIGIRMALGAAPSGIVRLVLSRVSILIAGGLVVGTAASLWLSRFVAPLMYGLEPRDPATFAGAVVTLAIVGVLAGAIPAYRASRIEPSHLLRNH